MDMSIDDPFETMLGEFSAVSRGQGHRNSEQMWQQVLAYAAPIIWGRDDERRHSLAHSIAQFLDTPECCCRSDDRIRLGSLSELALHAMEFDGQDLFATPWGLTDEQVREWKIGRINTLAVKFVEHNTHYADLPMTEDWKQFSRYMAHAIGHDDRDCLAALVTATRILSRGALDTHRQENVKWGVFAELLKPYYVPEVVPDTENVREYPVRVNPGSSTFLSEWTV